MPTTVAELKALEWKFTAHADGSDKRGRFSINFYEATFEGEKLQGFKKQWRAGPGSAGYTYRGHTYDTLAELAVRLNSIAGDDKEARPD